MKKWTVDFDMKLFATFEGIEADSESVAKEIAIVMLLDDPGQYLDFSDENEVDVWEEEAENGPVF